MNVAEERKATDMSVILAAPDGYSSVRQTVAHLRAQTARDRLELILLLPEDAEPIDSDDAAAFPSVVQIRIRHQSIGHANATGIRRASSPVVALAEDHCFPDSTWAKALLEAHRGGWAAVGPGVRNANPATAVSWADFFIGYGPWMLPARRSQVEFLPGHNSSYKKADLLAYGERLEDMMEAETLLHWDLHRRGRPLLLEPAAAVAHANFSLWRSWLPIQYHAGRLFGGSRALSMPGWRRLMYFAGSPLIPGLRLMRIARHALHARLLGRLIMTLPALAVGLALDGLGQSVGYLRGAGNSREKVAEYEYRRIDHVTDYDREHVFNVRG